MPRKMRRLAVRSALSAKFAASEVRFVDAFSFEKPRTKDMLATLAALQVGAGSTLIVIDQKNEMVQRSANNIPRVKTLLAHYLNVIDLLRFDTVIIARPAVDVIDSYLGSGGAEAGADESVAEEAV
jgi:large subunit ribosomal protein L4